MMFNSAKIYSNVTSSYATPLISSFLEDLLAQTPQDQELYNLISKQVKDNSYNRNVLTWGDPVPISFIFITAYTAQGTGPTPESSNKRAVEVTREFFDRINVSGQTIDDLFLWSYADIAIESSSLWRTFQTKDSSVNVDLARLDPSTLTKHREGVHGWEAFTQDVERESSYYYSKSAFYNSLRSPEVPASDVNTGSGGMMEHPGTAPSTSPSTLDRIIIPNEPEIVLNLEFFPRPLISPVLPYLSYKKFILWFMRNFSERHWNPARIGYVGIPGTMFPTDPKVFEAQRDDLRNAMIYLKNFSVLATAGYNKVEELGANTAKSSTIYTDYINAIDEQTMFSLCGSMGQRSASGNELATSRILEHGFLRHCQGLRLRYKRNLEYYCRKVLLPANGITVTNADFNLRFPPMQEEKAYDLVRALGEARKNVFFKDVNEPRRVLASLWEGIGDVDQEAAAKMDKMFENVINPPQPTTPFGGGTAKAKA